MLRFLYLAGRVSDLSYNLLSIRIDALQHKYITVLDE